MHHAFDKKIDYDALSSPFMRIPKMRVETARDLLDLGFRQIFELENRSAETIFEDLLKIKPSTPKDCLKQIEIAVQFSKRSLQYE